MTTNTATAGTGRRLTGWGVLAWLVLFFGAVFAVNGAMVYYAVTTFSGLEVPSSYKAGQDYEADVAAGRAQAERGWTVDVHPVLDAAGATVTATFAARDGSVIAGLDVAATIAHTVDVAHDRTASLRETSPGTYVGTLPDIGPGRWTLLLTADRRGARMFTSRNALILAR